MVINNKGTKGTKGTTQVIINSLMILILITASIPPSMAQDGDQEKIKIQEARVVVGDNKAEVTVIYTEQQELSDDEWQKKVEECAGPKPEGNGFIVELEKVEWEIRKAECEGKIPRTVTATFHETFKFDTTDRSEIIAEIARRLGVSEEDVDGVLPPITPTPSVHPPSPMVTPQPKVIVEALEELEGLDKKYDDGEMAWEEYRNAWEKWKETLDEKMRNGEITIEEWQRLLSSSHNFPLIIKDYYDRGIFSEEEYLDTLDDYGETLVKRYDANEISPLDFLKSVKGLAEVSPGAETFVELKRRLAELGERIFIDPHGNLIFGMEGNYHKMIDGEWHIFERGHEYQITVPNKNKARKVLNELQARGVREGFVDGKYYIREGRWEIKQLVTEKGHWRKLPQKDLRRLSQLEDMSKKVGSKGAIKQLEAIDDFELSRIAKRLEQAGDGLTFLNTGYNLYEVFTDPAGENKDFVPVANAVTSTSEGTLTVMKVAGSRAAGRGILIIGAVQGYVDTLRLSYNVGEVIADIAIDQKYTVGDFVKSLPGAAYDTYVAPVIDFLRGLFGGGESPSP